MTPAQQLKYFREWGRVRDVLKAKGLPCGDVERHNLHLKALGVRKSSKDFGNRDLDRVLAQFLSISEPDNLRAQLRLIDQPEARQQRALQACRELVARLPQIAASANPDLYAQNYLDALARKVRKAPLEQLDETGLAVIHGILRARLDGHKNEPQRPGDLSSAVEEEQAAAKRELRRVIDQDDNCPWL